MAESIYNAPQKRSTDDLSGASCIKTSLGVSDIGLELLPLVDVSLLRQPRLHPCDVCFQLTWAPVELPLERPGGDDGEGVDSVFGCPGELCEHGGVDGAGARSVPGVKACAQSYVLAETQLAEVQVLLRGANLDD